jgi:hypothetical protein
MGTDVERIVETLRLMHEMWASIPEIAVAVWLLSRQVSYAALLPVFVCLGRSNFQDFCRRVVRKRLNIDMKNSKRGGYILRG